MLSSGPYRQGDAPTGFTASASQPVHANESFVTAITSANAIPASVVALFKVGLLYYKQLSKAPPREILFFAHKNKKGFIMPVPSRITDLSATAASNSPAGTDPVGPNLDDYLRGIQAVLRGDLATKGADIASATTTDLGAVQGLFHDITGTTTITGFGTVAAGVWKVIKFEDALTLTHNATSLILQGGENRTTANGDIGIYASEGSGNWREYLYWPVAINPGKVVSTDETQTLTNKTLTSPTIGGTASLTGSLSGTASRPFRSIDSGNNWLFGANGTAYELVENSVGTVFSVATGGFVTLPLQSAFLAYNSATDTNVTGNGTNATVICDTEVFDQNGDFNNATGVFTAAATGPHRFHATVLMAGMTGATEVRITLVTSNRTYTKIMDGTSSGSGDKSISLDVFADMDAADTALVQVQASGLGADTADVYGTSSPHTWFSGALLT